MTMKLKFSKPIDTIPFFQQYNLVSKREIIIPKCSYFEFVEDFTNYKLKKHKYLYFWINVE